MTTETVVQRVPYSGHVSLKTERLKEKTAEIPDEQQHRCSIIRPVQRGLMKPPSSHTNYYFNERCY